MHKASEPASNSSRHMVQLSLSRTHLLFASEPLTQSATLTLFNIPFNADFLAGTIPYLLVLSNSIADSLKALVIQYLSSCKKSSSTIISTYIGNTIRPMLETQLPIFRAKQTTSSAIQARKSSWTQVYNREESIFLDTSSHSS